jgi:hypothetical protein
VAGTNITREDESVFTHAVIAEFDRASMVADATRLATERAGREWDVQSDAARATAGNLVSWGGMPFVCDEGTIAEASAFMKANPDREAYIAAEVESWIDSIRPADGELKVVQWAFSRIDAHRSLETWSKRPGNRNVRVVPVIRDADIPGQSDGTDE